MNVSLPSFSRGRATQAASWDCGLDRIECLQNAFSSAHRFSSAQIIPAAQRLPEHLGRVRVHLCLFLEQVPGSGVPAHQGVSTSLWCRSRPPLPKPTHSWRALSPTARVLKGRCWRAGLYTGVHMGAGVWWSSEIETRVPSPFVFHLSRSLEKSLIELG